MEEITKIEAAGRQINQALRLFFDGGDTVSLHTLASAAAQLIADLGRPYGLGVTRNKAVIKPDRWREFRQAITEYEVFFKHADQDPDPNAVLKFHPEMSELTLVEAIEVLRQLTGKLSHEAFWFCIWIFSTKPSLFLDSPLKQLVLASNAVIRPIADMTDRRLYAELLKQPPPPGLGSD
jgi:hypothetical protein